MSAKPIHLAILVGSNREGRLAPTIARWFTDQIRSDDSFSVDVIDLAEVHLPAVISDIPGPEAVAFCQRLADADAFVFVVPEYNHSFPAVLKHAIDLGYHEWIWGGPSRRGAPAGRNCGTARGDGARHCQLPERMGRLR
jgi:NAD(P)H-dependent FMN reductase